MSHLHIAACLSMTLCLSIAKSPAQQQDEIIPTLTPEMGDLGGTINGQVPDPAKTRHYYIAAEPELWDFTPEGRDPICGKPLPPGVVNNRNTGKVRYVEYTDATFSARMIETPRLGILGPVLRGVGGEYLAVTFHNRTMRPLSMHPHGVTYDKDSEGAYYFPAPGRGAAVAQGATFTYVWHLDEDSTPLPSEPSSKAWLYHSHVVPDEEANLGLIGFIVVTDPKRARPDGTPIDVDREMAALFMIHDESGLGAAAKEAFEYVGISGAPPAPTWAETQELLEISKRYAINGRIFGNLSGLEMIEGENVRWYNFGLGNETDIHTAHWHGETIIEDGHRRTDVVELFPASMKVADMRADNPGSWLFHCHVSEHMNEGMFTRFIIHPKDTSDARPALKNPFFGIPSEQASMRFKKADVLAGTGTTKVILRGILTTPNAFAVLANPVTVHIGDSTAAFTIDKNGVATGTNESAKLRIWTPCEFGVIYGGKLDFELELTGDPWVEEIQATRAVSVQVGKSLHLSTGLNLEIHF